MNFKLGRFPLGLLMSLCCLLVFGNSDELVKPAFYAETLSEPATIGQTINYAFEWTNETTDDQTIFFEIYKPRELACAVTLSDTKVTVKSGDVYKGALQVVMSDRIPVGGYEPCIVMVKDASGHELSRLKFITSQANVHPFMLVNDELIEEAKSKVANQAWAKTNLDNMLADLDTYEFPIQKVVTKPRPTQVWSSLNYVARDGEKSLNLAIAYKITGDKKYLDKFTHFLKALTDPEDGYMSVGAATTGVMVHEGNFFLFLSAACDLLYDEISETDRANLVDIMRLYLKQNQGHMNSAGIMNHQASANAGAIFVALYLQDVAMVDYLTYGEGGMADQISKGVMADGWWFESTVNYCYLVAQRYCLVAQAFENYGWDLFHKQFPVKYKSKDFVNAKEGFTGMKFDNWGPTGKSTRGVEDMVSPYVCMMDPDGVVVSSNDSRATSPDPYYEIAYRHYGGDDLAWVLSKYKRDSWVSLIYGVAELPEVEDPRTMSVHKDNVGITALRSQQENRDERAQIEAYVKFGTHGGWHGQFDRTGLLALNRNGFKYFGTEMAWYGYGKAGYKECVQTSVTHNMVTVDALQQEAVPSEQPLFYAGQKIQVSLTQTVARWRKIPIFNLDKFPPWNDTPYAEDFEPILQRRLSIVTDDYLVLADYMKSSQEHEYDWAIHPPGLKGMTFMRKKGDLLEVVDADETSPYKYFHDGQWYKMSKGGEFNFEEDGNKLDVHTLWPRKAEVLTSKYPNGGHQNGVKNNPNRNTVVVRVSAKEVVYLTLLEPYQGSSMIASISSPSEDKLTVKLTDGRIQTLTISQLRGEASDVQVTLEETNNGNLITETTRE